MNKLLKSLVFSKCIFITLIACLAWTACSDNSSSSTPSSDKAITAFSFTAATNSGNITTDVTATITGTAITVAVPAGTTVTALVATFTTTGSSVKVGTTAQVSGTTANDFTNAVTYTVTAADGTTQDYTVTVTGAVITKLYIFKDNITRDGNLGGRSGANAICEACTSKPASVVKTFAVISVSSTDTIATLPANNNFPSNVPIYAPDGTTKLADNWADFINGPVISLVTAGIFVGGDVWWSGSNSDSSFNASNNCSGWTSTSGNGRIGDSSAVDTFFINTGTAACSNNTAVRVLCVGY